MARATGRGSADRAPGWAARDHPSRDPSSHGQQIGRRSAEPRTRTGQVGSGMPGRARTRHPWSGSVAASLARMRRTLRRCPPTCAWMAAAASSAEMSARWRPFASEWIEEAGGIAHEQPSCARASGHAMAERPGPDDGVGPPAVRQAAVSSSSGVWPPTIPSATATAPRLASSARQLSVRARCRRSLARRRPGRSRRIRPEHQHPRIMFGSWVRIAEVIREADARPQAGSPSTPVVVATTERKPSAPTTTSALSRPGDPSGRRSSSRPLAGSNPVAVQPRRTSAPACSAIVRSAGSSVERSKPTAGSPPVSGPVRQPKRRPARRLDSHGRDRAGDGAQRRFVEADPAATHSRRPGR